MVVIPAWESKLTTVDHVSIDNMIEAKKTDAEMTSQRIQVRPFKLDDCIRENFHFSSELNCRP